MLIAKEFIGENWLWIIVSLWITWTLFKKWRNHTSANPDEWRIPFWIALAITLLLNLYFLYDAYQEVNRNVPTNIIDYRRVK